jgi:fucose 4-O-acetylase-like acetyltransferase
MNARQQPTRHLLYIDNIRIVLICLVILTHLAITYGAFGSWFYNEVEGFSPETALLTLVTALSQSFMMGFFFLIAAYFIPPSYGRKGPGRFVHDRLVRLGIPLLVWVLLIGPLLRYYVEMKTGGFSGTLAEWYSLGTTHITIFGLGPLWFVFTLLVFTLLYVLWRVLFAERVSPGNVPFPSLSVIIGAGILIGVLTFLVRIVMPIESSWEFFDIQPPFFVQYIAFFLLGLYAAKNNWFSRIPDRPGKTSTILAVFLALCLPVVLVASGALSGTLDPLLGGLHWQSLLYSLWEQIFAVLIVTGMLWIFFTRFDHTGKIASSAAAATYTVYIIHPVVIIPLTLSMQPIMLSPVPKFLLAAIIAIPLSFLLAVLIRSIPGVDRVL